MVLAYDCDPFSKLRDLPPPLCMCVRVFLLSPGLAAFSLYFQDMAGLLLDSCNNIWFEGTNEFEFPDARLSPPTGGDQAASVVITGDSSEIVFQNCQVTGGGSGACDCDNEHSEAGQLYRARGEVADVKRCIHRPNQCRFVLWMPG